MTSKTRITMIATVAVLIVILAGMQTTQIQNLALASPIDDDDCELVPCWIKNTAGYWVEGSSTTIEYLYAIEWLIDHGIITVDTVSAVSDSEDFSDDIVMLHARIDNLELETIPHHLDWISADLHNHSTDLASHTIRLDLLEMADDQGTPSTTTSSIESELEDISDRISDLEFCRSQGQICDDDLDALESDIADLQDSLDILDSDISEIFKDMYKFERALSSLEKALDKLETAIDELDSHKDKESDKEKWEDEP